MKKKVEVGKVATAITAISIFLIVLIVLTLLFVITKEGYPKITLQFLLKAPEKGMVGGGIFPAIVGTFLLVIVMSIFGIPFGTLTALYLTEYAGPHSKLARFVRFAVNNLASVPSIVFGLFGLGFFIGFLGGSIDKLFLGGSLKWGKPCLLWASLTMALLTLPVVIVSVEESLKAVPYELREAAYSLGATKFEVAFKVVLPHALTGVLTGGILAVSRGAGEVAPILFTGAAYFLPKLPSSLSDQFMELGYHIYVMSTQSVNVDLTKPIQFATTLVLLALTFLLNFTAIILRRKMRVRRR